METILLSLLMAMAVFALGFFLGRAPGAKGRDRRQEPEEAPERRDELIEQQRAFEELLSYNAEDAYGLDRMEGA